MKLEREAAALLDRLGVGKELSAAEVGAVLILALGMTDALAGGRDTWSKADFQKQSAALFERGRQVALAIIEGGRKW